MTYAVYAHVCSRMLAYAHVCVQTGEAYPISLLLEGIEPEIIDYMDLDIQGSELPALTEPGFFFPSRIQQLCVLILLYMWPTSTIWT